MKHILSYILFFCFLLAACSPTFISQNQQTQFTPDGLDIEWPEKMLYNTKSGWIYGVTHDAKNLYIFLEVESPSIQSKILVTGFTLWIDAEGRKNKKQGIHFPIGAPKAPPADIKYANLSRVDLMAMQHNSLNDLKSLELIGFNGRTVWRELSRQKDIIPRIGFDRESRLLYEIRIPYNAYFQIDPNQTISIGLETGSFGRPNQLEGLSGRPGENETLNAQSRVAALSELTVPTEMWLKKVQFN